MSQRNVESVPGWLIRHAARRAPESLSQRLEEEWLADLAARTSTLSRLRFAAGCCWATQVIAVEFQPSSVPVSSAAVAGKLLDADAYPSAYTDRDAGYFSRRSGTLFIVLSLHGLLFYGLITTLSHIRGTAVPDPLQNLPVDDRRPHEPPPQVPQPQLDGVKIQVPKIDDYWQRPDPDTDVTTGVITEPLPPGTPVPPPQAVQRVLGGPGAGFPDLDDFYPTQARIRDEQGIATVQVCVDPRGRLTADPTTLQSTGSSRLDEGALKLARAGSGHYRPSTENGQPVNSCYAFRVRFQLKS